MTTLLRTLAGVPERAGIFMKIVYNAEGDDEDAGQYDTNLGSGHLAGGARGGRGGETTFEAFQRFHDAQKKYGARVALFGRKIKTTRKHQPDFIEDVAVITRWQS